MSRKKSPPKDRSHSSGQARVCIDGKIVYLGEFGSPESFERYGQLLNQWNQKQRTDCTAPRLLNAATIDQLCCAYLAHANQHYRKNGEPTSEVSCIRIALRHLIALYGPERIADFDILKFEAVCDRMIEAGYVRKSINRHMGRLRRAFVWGRKKRLVPKEVVAEIRDLEGLQKDRSDAKEGKPVTPVPIEHIEAIQQHVTLPIWWMIQLQLFTGMRPGEVMAIRGCDLRMTEPVWEYVPESHKTEHHHRSRRIFIGPNGQQVLRPFLKPDIQEFLFCPKDAVGARLGSRQPGDRYTVYSYHHAIQKACRRAGVALWTPHRIRHNAATNIRRETDLDGARTVLGHTSVAMTEEYAERDWKTARQIMAKIG